MCLARTGGIVNGWVRVAESKACYKQLLLHSTDDTKILDCDVVNDVRIC